ncbi:hypothetical protein ACI65C_004220 [Semiaphis heraclei]
MIPIISVVGNTYSKLLYFECLDMNTNIFCSLVESKHSYKSILKLMCMQLNRQQYSFGSTQNG